MKQDFESEKNNIRSQTGFVIAVLIPFIALGLQWLFWDYISPFVWFLFFPAVFISARLGGLMGGMFSTIISIMSVVYFFMPPQLSWEVKNPYNLFSVGMFLVMGYLFSDIQERFRVANQRTKEALKETRAANEKITQLYEKTRELDELKTQFFANVSHELRTPLTLIMGPIRKTIQSAEGLNPEIRRDLEVVERNARFLYRHVNDLLDVSKLDAGHMAVHYSQIDISQITRVVASQFNVIANERGIRYTVSAPDVVIAQVDAKKYERILLNLLSNAFKFTPDNGQVNVSLEAASGNAVIQVSDSGPGIPNDKRDIIFERFRQLEGNAARKHGGTGLGLSIVKEFVLLQHGEIKVDTAPTGGALFTLHIPLSIPTEVDVEIEAGSPSFEMDDESSLELMDELFMERATVQDAGLSSKLDAPLILVVEDNPDMNNFICNALAKYYRVSTAMEGQAGLDKAIALKPNLILTDMMMPNMSGDQMARAIRQHADLKDIPIVMLTAKADEQLRVEMLKETVQDYIEKPFTVEELLARVANLLSARRQAAEELRQSMLQNSTILKVAMDGFWLTDAATQRLIEVNDAYCQMSGYSRAELLQMNVSQLEALEQPDDISAHMQRVQELGADRFETTHQRKDGSTFRIDISVQYLAETGKTFAFLRDITERKRVEENLRMNEEHLSRIIETVPNGITFVERSGNISFANRAAEKILGLTRSDIINRVYNAAGWKITAVDGGVFPEEQFPFTRVMQTDESVYDIQHAIEYPDGTRAILSINAAPLHDADGNLFGMVATFTNITERKQMDEALRKNEENLQMLFETMSEGIALNEIIYDENGEMIDYRILNVNKAFYSTADYRGSTVVGNVATKLYGMSSEFIKEFWKQHKEKNSTVYTEMYSPLDNHCFFVSTSPFINDRFVTSFFDITDRKHAEEVLRESEERYHTVVSNAPVIIFVTDEKGVFTLSDGQGLKGLGLQPGQVVGQSVFDVYHDYPAIVDMMKNALAGHSQQSEIEVQGVVFDTLFSPVCDPNGKVVKVIGISTDVTKRKQAEEALHESEEKYRLLFENAGDAIFIHDRNAHMLAVNPMACEQLGYTHAELMSMTIDQVDMPQEAQHAPARIARLMEQGSHAFETTHRRKDGSPIATEVSARLITWDGQPAMMSLCRDITERRHIEKLIIQKNEELRKAKEKAEENENILNLFLQHSPILMYLKDENIRAFRLSSNFEPLLGMPVQQILGKTNDELWPSDFAKKMVADDLMTLNNNTKIEVEEELNGRFYTTIKFPVQMEGKPRYLAGFSIDITARKRTDDALRESEDKFKYFFEHSTVGKSLTLPTGEVNVNQALCDILGYTLAEFKNKKWQEVTHAEDIELTQRNIDQLLSGKRDSARFIKRFIHKDGSVVWVDLNSSIRRDADGKPLYLMSSMIDITERKQAENELQIQKDKLELKNKQLAQSKQELQAAVHQYSDLYDFAPVGYFTLNRDGIILQTNLAGANLLGVEYEKLIRQNISSFVSTASRSDFDIFFKKLLISDEKETCELELLKDESSPIWVNIKASAFEGGLESRAVMIDITERKQTEELLRESEVKYRTVANFTYDWETWRGPDGAYLYISPSCERITGHTVDEFLADPNLVMKITHPDDLEKVKKHFDKAFSNSMDEDLDLDFRIFIPNGGVRWIGHSCIAVFGADGQWLGRRESNRDITERKMLQLDLEIALIRERQLAYTDVLTGINNRRHLYKLAEHEFEIAARYQQPLSVIMFDIDHFKQVNDTFGHAAGDQILQKVTKVACAELRSVDVIGRYGGEEFVVVVPMTNAQQAYPLAERIRIGVEQLRVPTEKGEAAVTLSIGIVEISHGAQNGSAEELIRRADKAMYAAKQAGRNRTIIFGQEKF